MKKPTIFSSLAAILVLAIATVFLWAEISKSKAVVYEHAQQIVDNQTKIVADPEPKAEVKSEPIVESKPVVLPPVTQPVKKPAPAPVVPKAKPAPKPVAKAAPVPAPAAKPANCEIGTLNTQFLCLLNQYRKSKGLNTLTYDSAMNLAANDHSVWMNETGSFSHTGENGTRFFNRCAARNVKCDGENLAKGYTTAQRLLDAWKASPTHNANMLGSHTKMGLSLVGIYATLVLK